MDRDLVPAVEPTCVSDALGRHQVVAQTVLLAGSAMISITGSCDGVEQWGPRERLGQEANGSGLQRAGADALLGKGRDKDKRRGVPLGAHMGQEVATAHGVHLKIRK